MENGHKFFYMGQKKWLPNDHPSRYDDVGFDGIVELRCALIPSSGSDILVKLNKTTFTYGKRVLSNEVDEKDEK